jgi:cytoskeletal protein CcmA (bactofilin family)
MWREKMKKENDQIKAYMGEDTVFKGSLNFDGTVRIDGKFEGQVFTNDTLIIGATGHLIAEISAGTIICMGLIEGKMIASKKVEIHANSRVIGNIKSPALYVELGGVLDGTCDMSGKETKITPLVKPEEKEKKVSSEPTKG